MKISTSLAILLSTTLLIGFTHAQGPGGKGKGKGKGRPGFAELEKEAVSQKFVGVTTDGKVEEGLFKIEATGVSTKPIQVAAEKFLAALSPEQRKITTFPVDDNEWRRWANQHSLVRQGVSFKEMSKEQRELAFDLIGAGLSAKGLETTQDIMKLNETLAELSGKPDEYGRWLYHMTVMGEPSETEPWGWQFDGHHCVINYFVLGDQIVMSPYFVGSEPVVAKGGRHEGTIILQEEQNAGIAFARSLTDEQKSKAVIQEAKDGTNAMTEAFKDNVVLDFAGLPVSELSGDQQKAFLDLVGMWTGHIRDGHAQVKMEEVKKHLGRTYFAWIGAMDEDAVFYYRIHSPVVLIEFDHQRPIGLERTGVPTREHIHAVVRTPNGNDYGKDLLRLHHEKHPH